jgi:hypothetical protein
MDNAIKTYIDAFCNGRMTGFNQILDYIENGKTLDDIRHYIENNEEYKKWCS